MLKRRRSDWFSIVATDLFCGVLAAVIILDAVSPKEIVGVNEPTALVLQFNRSPQWRCAQDTAMFVSIRSNGQWKSSLDSPSPSVTETAAACMYRFLIEADGASVNLREARVLIGQLPALSTRVKLRLIGAGSVEFVCDGDTGRCVAV